MSREIKKDLDELYSYIGGYSTKSMLSDSRYASFVSICQKRYYSFLTFIGELEQYSNAGISEEQYLFLKESCSDCGLSLFDALHGNYKGAKLLMRSSIENFVKGYMYNVIPNITKEKNVYALFESVKQSYPFTESDIQPLYNRIHDIYKELCAIVHTATKLQLSSMTAFSIFPYYEEKESKYISTRLLKLVDAYVTLLALKYNKEYHSFHFSNKGIINTSLLNQYKKKVQNIE